MIKRKKFTAKVEECQHLTVWDQQLLIDKNFLSILERACLKISDLQEIAESCCVKLSELGLLRKSPGILFTCGAKKLMRKNNFIFSYGEIAPIPIAETTVNAVILAFQKRINKEILEIERMCLQLPQSNRQQVFKEMIHDKLGFSLAHELTHAFGINRKSPQFQHSPILELEIVTDAVAFLSCERILGDAAYLGAAYIYERIKADPALTVSQDTFRDVALATVKSLQRKLDV